ncbi:hypothetical protein [Halorussus lipolyticus]|uniref:hypothetical protein n=1 Tax=Halorussus lipolyticus TaxID=3034024 RepID=UPI0023E87863|nr:hypothetical protein [Halorussus sp. DT80]
MEPRITTHASQTGLDIFDPIEHAQFALFTPTAVDPTTSDVALFPVPITTAVRIETTDIEIPSLSNIYVRSPTGDLLAETSGQTDRSLPHGEYVLELTTAPVKLYLRVESTLDIEYRDATVRISFGTTPVCVHVGARSFHEQPAGMITVPDDPRDLMDAVSLFGSALKDTSPERSFPTLRGHPPLLERGETFDAPSDIKSPATGVRLELPPEYGYVYPAVSLAYYLGAAVEPAQTPRLVTTDGFEYRLDGPLGYEEVVSRTLQQVFFFDCLTRTEGLYEVDLHERNQVEPLVDLDFETLYDQSLPEQLAAYLSVPFSVVEPYLPQWMLTMDIVPESDHAPMLPFAAAQLAFVRSPTPDGHDPAPTPDMLTEFTRGTNTRNAGGVLTRSAGKLHDSSDDDIFTPKETDSLRHAWVGDGYPLGATKATKKAYERQLEQETPEQSSITIHVVCNDAQMESEGVVEEFYGVRELLEFDVNIHYGLTSEEVRELLETSVDFFHFIGHVDANGLRCPDGHLDARTLDDVNVKAFLLNACRSYAQGEALVKAGSLGGVVTLSEITNSTGTQVGCALAKALNRGYPLQAAVNLVQRVVAGYSYMTIGDGGLALVQSKSGCCLLSDVAKTTEGWQLDLSTVPMREFNMGTLFDPTVGGSSTQYLASGPLDSFEVTDAELERHFTIDNHPVVYDGDLFWSNEITAKDLRES